MSATFDYTKIRNGSRTLFCLLGNFGDGPRVLARIDATELVIRGIVGALRHMDRFLESAGIEEIVEKAGKLE